MLIFVPNGCIYMEAKGSVACIKDDKARFQRTSSGMTYLLARGVVFCGSVAFDKQFQTVFTRVDQLADISALY